MWSKNVSLQWVFFCPACSLCSGEIVGLTETVLGNSLVPQGRRVINHGEHQAGAAALSSPLTAAPVQGGRGTTTTTVRPS